MNDHGAYYRHCCPACGSTLFEPLPMLACPNTRCNAPLDDDCVTFDVAKRTAELASTLNIKTAADMEGTKP